MCVAFFIFFYFLFNEQFKCFLYMIRNYHTISYLAGVDDAGVSGIEGDGERAFRDAR